MKAEVDLINEEFEANKEAIRKEGKWRRSSHRLSNKYQRTKHLERSVKADPLLPNNIRTDITQMLKERAFAMSQAEIEALQQYEQELAEGKGGVNFNKDNLEHNWTYVQGLVSSRLNTMGFDEQQSEQSVENIRLKIQEYLDSFSPTR
jgi:hypothetical protein